MVLPWYKKFFEKYYFPFLSGRKTFLDTQKETRFILNVLSLKKGSKILDLACGAGRHAIELAKNGCLVAGLDLNSNCLTKAKQKAKKIRLSISFLHSDMRRIPFTKEFDAVISMFSSFGYLETEKDNDEVLKKISGALKDRGALLLDLQNKNWVLKNVPVKAWDEQNGLFLLEKRQYDAEKKVYNNEITIISPRKKIERVYSSVRLYELAEIKDKLKQNGFSIAAVFGGYNKTKFNIQKSQRMIILAQKKRKEKIKKQNAFRQKL